MMVSWLIGWVVIATVFGYMGWRWVVRRSSSRSLNGDLDVHGHLVLLLVFLALQVHLVIGRIVPRLTSAVAEHQVNRTAHHVHDRRRYEHHSPGCLSGLKRLTSTKRKFNSRVKQYTHDVLLYSIINTMLS